MARPAFCPDLLEDRARDCVIATALWSRDGPKVWSQVCGSCSRRRCEVWCTGPGQAGVFRKKLNLELEIKDE